MGNSSSKSLGGASFRSGGFFFSILRRRIGRERTEKPPGDVGYFIDCGQERILVGLRWFVKASDFPHKLEGSGSNLFGGDGRIEVEQGFDIPAHLFEPPAVQNPQMAKKHRRFPANFILNPTTLLVVGKLRTRERAF
jgi:hypothetical protein